MLSKFYSWINNKILFNNTVEHPSVQAQQQFLASIPEPKDMLERSYDKYRCLLFCSYSGKQKLIMNTVSFFAMILLIPYCRLRGLKYDKAMASYQPQDKLLRKVSQRIPIDDIFPQKLNEQYAQAEDYDGKGYADMLITRDAFAIFRRSVRKHPFSFHFNMVLFIRLAQACSLLMRYHPAAVTTYVCEREFADPLVTEFYESHGVQYHGFMHGDFIYTIRQAFMHLTKYWMWAEHYDRLFQDLRCLFEREIYVPGKYSGIVKPREKIEDYPYYATYYFSAEKKKDIEVIKRSMMRLQQDHFRCKVRPHPRFSQTDLIYEVFGNDMTVENPKEVSIEESLDCSHLTISLTSTVLSQAYYSGKKIVLDDVTDPQAFGKLREIRYILVDKADMLLSELLDQRKDANS